MNRAWLAIGILAASHAAAKGEFKWPSGAAAAVCLTYDDGVDVHLDNAVPDLEAAGFRGTFYVHGSSVSLQRRMAEWRAIAARGHELGNHTVFHPCLKVNERGVKREWLAADRMLEKYTVAQIAAEVRAMNTTLLAVDGKASRTYGFTCSDRLAGGKSYVDAIRPLVPAARTGETMTVADPRTVDLHQVPSWMVYEVSGERLIAFARQALESGGLAVFMFHGVGGGHGISIRREAHRELLAWLAANRKRVWTDTFQNVTAHIAAQRAGKRP